MRTRSGRVKFLTVVGIATALFTAMMLYVFVPAWLNLHVVHEIVRSSALKWYANDEKSAAEKELYYRLEQEGFDYIGEDDCQIFEDGDLRVVSCRWEYYAYYPFDLGYYGHLHFSSRSEVDSSGRQEQVGGLGRALWFEKEE